MDCFCAPDYVLNDISLSELTSKLESFPGAEEVSEETDQREKQECYCDESTTEFRDFQHKDDVVSTFIKSSTHGKDSSCYVPGIEEWCNLVCGDYLESKDNYAAVKPFKYEDIKLTRDEIDGWLSPRILASGLSLLWSVPGMNCWALTKLVLTNKGLEDISELLHCPHLLYIDLSYNKICDLSYLRNCKKVVFLNLSHNQISSLDDMVVPIYLTDLNISHNSIFDLNGISVCWSLRCLNASYNLITSISDVEDLKFLSYLNLSYNKINVIKNLPDEYLEYLFLKNNSISSWKQTKPLTNLKRLELSCNRFTSLSFFKNLYKLKILNISDNLISSMSEINHFTELKSLRSIIITGNQVMEMSEIGLLILYLTPTLMYFNQFLINRHERLTASRLYNSKLVNIAYNNFILQMAQRHTKGPAHLGLDKSYKVYNPGVVLLVGPPGSFKKKIIRQIAEINPKFVKCCNLHTTQEKVGPAMDYVFNYTSKKEFDKLVNTGKTVFHDIRYGKQYALCWSEISLCGKICMAAVELQDALNMVWQGLKPTLIFTMTKDSDIHRARLYDEFKDFSFKFYEAFKDNRWRQCMKTKQTPEGEVPDCQLKPHDIYNLLRFVNYGNEQQPDLDYSAYILSSMDTNREDEQRPTHTRRYHFVAEEGEESVSEVKFSSEQKSSPSESSRLTESTLTTERSISCLPQRFHDCVPDDNETSDSTDDVVSASSHSEYIESLIEYILSTRNEYIEIHESRPGLFIRAVASDDLDKAVEEISAIAHEVYQSRLFNRKMTSDPLAYHIKEDPLYDEAVTPVAKELLNELLEGDCFKVPTAPIIEEEYDDAFEDCTCIVDESLERVLKDEVKVYKDIDLTEEEKEQDDLFSID